MSRLYNCRPSDVMNITDDYTAFCFDEACAYIRIKLDAGEVPNYEMNEEAIEQNEYSNFKDFYKNIGG